MDLSGLKPKRSHKVFDLVEEAGFDTSDWISSSSNPRGYKANPKYCYRWSFVEPGRVAIFNLWHGAMAQADGVITHSENYRANAEHHKRTGGKSNWITRGHQLDGALKAVALNGLPVRVIILDGVRRHHEDPDRRSSSVNRRELDREPWHLRSYDWETGAFVLVRGPASQSYSDQFDLPMAEEPVRQRDMVTRAYVREAAIRRSTLVRAQGRCELCGAPGFLMASGRIYLETHHIVPLCEGGADHVTNVIALCPNDHRRAHYAAEQEELRNRMIGIVERKR